MQDPQKSNPTQAEVALVNIFMNARDALIGRKRPHVFIACAQGEASSRWPDRRGVRLRGCPASGLDSLGVFATPVATLISATDPAQDVTH